MLTTYCERWEISRFATVFEENNKKNATLESFHALQFCFGNIIPKKKYELNPDLKNTYSKYMVVKSGDIMLNGLNLNYDFVTQRVGKVKEEGIITSAYISLHPRDGYISDYYCYLLKSFDSRKLFNGMGTGIRLTLSYSLLKDLYVPVPAREEQEQIVSYLDWKVSEINKLILAKKKQISLLLEHRQIVIDETVLKSCLKDEDENSKAPYGLIIPENWSVLKFNGFFKFFKGLGITKADLVDEGVSVISYGQVHSKLNTGTEINDSLIRFVDEKYLEISQNSLVKQGDFIFADTSEDFEGVGNCVFVNRDTTIFAGYHTLVARPKDGKMHRYLAYLFMSSFWRYQLRKSVNGVKVYSVTQKILKNTLVIIPPENEQESIVSHLDEKCFLISKTIDKIKSEILLLEELKKSIISNVVTGQIDVSEMEVPEFEIVEENDDDFEEDDSIEEESDKEEE